MYREAVNVWREFFVFSERGRAPFNPCPCLRSSMTSMSMNLFSFMDSQSRGDISHQPDVKTALLFARTPVTFPDTEHHHALAGACEIVFSKKYINDDNDYYYTITTTSATAIKRRY